jgi:di/tricarboxylate transporter
METARDKQIPVFGKMMQMACSSFVGTKKGPTVTGTRIGAGHPKIAESSGNAGGMVTTIASVQNILAIKYINESGAMSISFIGWIAFAGTTALVILALEYIYVRFRYRTKVQQIEVEILHMRNRMRSVPGRGSTPSPSSSP